LNWLLERPPILLNGLGPQPIKEYSFSLTASETRMVQWLFLAGMPGAVLALGGLVWLRRRK
jgi:LPXTG-motif cell wall-anchored protein